MRVVSEVGSRVELELSLLDRNIRIALGLIATVG